MTQDKKEDGFISDAEWAEFLGEETETEVSGSSNKKTARRKKSDAKRQVEAQEAPCSKSEADASKGDRQKSKGTSNTDYEVGYGKPPKHTRFKPGQSGNPKGRPKGSRNIQTDVLDMLKSPVAVNDNGKNRKISTQRASLLRLKEKALKGDSRSLDRLLALAAAYNNKEEFAPQNAGLSGDHKSILKNYRDRIKKETEDE